MNPAYHHEGTRILYVKLSFSFGPLDCKTFLFCKTKARYININQILMWYVLPGNNNKEVGCDWDSYDIEWSKTSTVPPFTGLADDVSSYAVVTPAIKMHNFAFYNI